MRPSAYPAFAVVIAAAVLLLPAMASAFPLSGCTLQLTSADAGGDTLDTAAAGAADATQADPFVVDWDGSVSWTGTTGTQVITEHTWHVDVFGLPTPLRGGDPNDDRDTSGSDAVDVSDTLPFRFTGLFFVSGEMNGEGGSCSGSGWLRMAGDPVGTLPFFAGLALVLLGAVLTAVGARGRWLPALVGGLLLGMGAAILLVAFAVLPVGAATPLAVLVLGIVLGAAAGWLGRRSTPAPA